MWIFKIFILNVFLLTKFKAGVRTLTPREEKFIKPEIKFKRSLFVRNAMRLKQIGMEVLEWAQFMQSCVEWDSPLRSLVSFIASLAFVYFFELYMFPLLLLLVLLKNYFWVKVGSYFNVSVTEDKVGRFVDSVLCILYLTIPDSSFLSVSVFVTNFFPIYSVGFHRRERFRRGL